MMINVKGQSLTLIVLVINGFPEIGIKIIHQ
jgi:hypothetical protein